MAMAPIPLGNNNRAKVLALVLFSLVFMSSFFSSPARAATTWYVDTASPEGGSGSQTSPFKTINAAEAAASSGDQIRVKQGTYSLTATITLKSGVYLRGGYDGSWTQTGTPGATAIDGQNSVQCMSGDSLSAATTIENFTIKRGYKNFSGGGGLYLNNSSPIIRNCAFTSNGASGGGGIYNNSSSPTISSCTFTSNGAGMSSGGGISNYASSNSIINNCTFTSNSGYNGGGIWNSSSSSPTITNCTFASNEAAVNGGGIFNYISSPEVQNCTFTSNKATEKGGGIYNGNSSSTIESCTFTSNGAVGPSGYGGGIWNNLSSPTIKNCTFTSNSAYESGGLGNSSSSPIIQNCTFNSNSAIMGCGGIWSMSSSFPTIKNSIIYGNTGQSIYTDGTSTSTVTYSCIGGGYAGTGNISGNPLFVGAPSNVHLQAGSPCKDTGTSVGAPSIDLDGISRPQGSGYDMGAYEYKNPPIYVDAAVGGPGTGTQADPFKTINSAEVAAVSGDEIRVKQGTYTLAAGAPITLKSGVTLTGGFNSSWIKTGTPGTTVINGGSSGRCMSGEALSAATIIENFTIQGGYPLTGAGLYLTNGSAPTIQNCIFSGNVTTNNGGGIYNSSSSPIIQNCAFTSNQAYNGTSGGGIFNDSSSPTITNCTFTSSHADGVGGGIYNSASSPTITNCTVTSNSADNWGGGGGGGGIYNSGGSPTIKNSIIYGNTSNGVPNNIAGAVTVTYSCIGGVLWSGTGNISAEPLFVNAPSNMRLQSGSPCIDTGTSVGAPSVDLDGISRPQGSGYDMGAYEYHVVESSYTTKVGTLGSWEWRKAQPGESVPSGTPGDWHWQIWDSGSGRKVPQGTAPLWNWGNE